MQSFQVFIPIQKGEPGQPFKITETMQNGETRTRYRLKGIASTTSLDRDSERVTRACIEDMVDSIRAKKLPIFGNHQHDWENMLGYANGATALGNELEIDILTAYVETHPKVAQLVSDLEGGLPLGLSVGGKVIEDGKAYEPSLKKEIKLIKKIGLLETSVVGIGSNPDAFLSLPEQISKSLKSCKAREVGGFESPEPGDLPEKGKEILARVYAKARKDGMSKERASKIAWGAVRRAGYKAIDKEEFYLKEAEEDFEEFLEKNFSMQKTAGQTGVVSYGKLGEQTVEQTCPGCGRPAELRKLSGGSAFYLCAFDGTTFEVSVKGKKLVTVPVDQPARMPAQNIEQQQQKPLGGKTKGLNASSYVKKDNGGTFMKEEEEEGEKPSEEKKKKTAKEIAEEKPEEDEEEKSYKAFVKFMARFKKEATEKAEGVTVEPGEENADAKNTIGGSGGAGTAANSKSAKDFETMKKAIKENVGTEGLEKGQSEKEVGMDFKSMREEQMKRK